MKLRSQPEKNIVPLNEIAARIRSELAALAEGIGASVLPVEYND